LDLTQRLLENQAQHPAPLDNQIRVVRLYTTRCSARCRPQGKRIFANSDSQFTALLQAFVVLRPVGDPILFLRDLVTMSGIEFVRHLQHSENNRPPQDLPWFDPCINAHQNTSATGPYC
jgi:hypothetical protein